MLSYTVRVFYMYLLILGFYKHYFYMCLYAFSIEIMLPTVLSNGRYCLRFVLPKRQYYVLPHIESKNSYLNICLFSHTQCSYVVLYCIFYCYLLIFGCYTVNTAFSTFVCVYAFFVFNYVMWARNIRLTWSLSWYNATYLLAHWLAITCTDLRYFITLLSTKNKNWDRLSIGYIE